MNVVRTLLRVVTLGFFGQEEPLPPTPRVLTTEEHDEAFTALKASSESVKATSDATCSIEFDATAMLKTLRAEPEG